MCLKILYVFQKIQEGEHDIQEGQTLSHPVKDKHKAKLLFGLLTDLDFVNVVKTSEQEDEDSQTLTVEQSPDFFSFAGLWAIQGND